MAATDSPHPASISRFPHEAVSHSCPPRVGQSVVFWLLVSMGLSTFAPCVLLPQWRQYEALNIAGQSTQHRLDLLRDHVDKERRLLDALRSDPAVVGRLAQRDLGFRRPFEQVVRVDVSASFEGADETSVGAGIPMHASPVIGAREAHCTAWSEATPHRCSTAPCDWRPQPVRPPATVARVIGYLPDYNYDRVFCGDDTRLILMGLSAALIVLAFALFGRRRVRA